MDDMCYSFILRNLGVVINYTTLAGMVAIGVGGISSALWGKSSQLSTKIRYKKILKDFLM